MNSKLLLLTFSVALLLVAEIQASPHHRRGFRKRQEGGDGDITEEEVEELVEELKELVDEIDEEANAEADGSRRRRRRR